MKLIFTEEGKDFLENCRRKKHRHSRLDDLSVTITTYSNLEESKSRPKSPAKKKTEEKKPLGIKEKFLMPRSRLFKNLKLPTKMATSRQSDYQKSKEDIQKEVETDRRHRLLRMKGLKSHQKVLLKMNNPRMYKRYKDNKFLEMRASRYVKNPPFIINRSSSMNQGNSSSELNRSLNGNLSAYRNLGINKKLLESKLVRGGGYRINNSFSTKGGGTRRYQGSASKSKITNKSKLAKITGKGTKRGSKSALSDTEMAGMETLTLEETEPINGLGGSGNENGGAGKEEANVSKTVSPIKLRTEINNKFLQARDYHSGYIMTDNEIFMKEWDELAARIRRSQSRSKRSKKSRTNYSRRFRDTGTFSKRRNRRSTMARMATRSFQRTNQNTHTQESSNSPQPKNSFKGIQKRSKSLMKASVGGIRSLGVTGMSRPQFKAFDSMENLVESRLQRYMIKLIEMHKSKKKKELLRTQKLKQSAYRDKKSKRDWAGPESYQKSCDEMTEILNQFQKVYDKKAFRNEELLYFNIEHFKYVYEKDWKGKREYNHREDQRRRELFRVLKTRARGESMPTTEKSQL